MAALQNPDMSIFMRELVRSCSDQQIPSNFSVSVSSDESQELYDSSVGTTPDLVSSPPLTTDNSETSCEKNVDSMSPVSDTQKDELRASSGGKSEKPRRSISPHELTVDEFQSRRKKRASTDSIAAEEPQRRRSRRRASKVLMFAQATADKAMHVPNLLERYQVSSLACCSDLVSLPVLRELIQTSERNSEGQNYKLSYEREPQ